MFGSALFVFIVFAFFVFYVIAKTAVVRVERAMQDQRLNPSARLQGAAAGRVWNVLPSAGMTAAVRGRQRG